MNQNYNKIGRELNNQVKSLCGKKTNDINLLYKLRNNIVSITPKISNQEIIRELRKSRQFLTDKIKKTKMKLKGSKNNIFSKIRRLATIQKTKTNNIEELEKLLKEKKRIKNSLKKNHNYTDNSIKNLLKNIKNKWGNDTNSAYLTFSIIKEKFNSQKGKRVQNNSLEKRQAMYNNLIRQRENLYKLKKYMPENKKKELSLFLKPLKDKISDTKKGIKKIQNKKNNLNNNTNAIGMLLEQEFKRNNPNINNIQSVSSSTKRLKPGKYRITKNNITKL